MERSDWDRVRILATATHLCTSPWFTSIPTAFPTAPLQVQPLAQLCVSHSARSCAGNLVVVIDVGPSPTAAGIIILFVILLMASKKSTFMSQRPIVSRPPALILPTLSSADHSLPQTNSFLSAEKRDAFYHSIKEEPVKDYGDQLAAQNDYLHYTDIYSNACKASFGNQKIRAFDYVCPYRASQNTSALFPSLGTDISSNTSLCSDFSEKTEHTSIQGRDVAPRVISTITGIITPVSSPLPVSRRSAARGSQLAGYNTCQLSAKDSHSEGYSTCSSSRSWTSSASSNGRKFPNFTTYSHRSEDDEGFLDQGSGLSPVVDPLSLPLPPAEYIDAVEEGFTSCDLSLTQKSTGTISDFFSQSGSSSGSLSLCDGRRHQLDKSTNCREKSANYDSNAFVIHPPSSVSLPELGDKHSLSVDSAVTSDVSPVRSPVAKRGRFGLCESDGYDPGGEKTQSDSVVLDLERYCNEYAKETYFWLCHQEATIHAIGTSFMAAQKLGGASEANRRTAIMRAISEMRKLRHTVESIHLGAYIMDKCLDSFHIASGALVDVCAVSMVLGTKMEEYDSLRPGIVDGLAGASRDRSRLCQIEKRIIHELDDGLCFPTPLVFANFMLAYIRSDQEQIRFAHYLLELALLESRFRDDGGARVAHAAVCISFAMVKKKDTIFDSECQALLDVEIHLFDLTKLPVGSTRDVMRELAVEMGRAVEEKHPVLIDYLAEDNKRVCFCEISPALWNFICGAHAYLWESSALEIFV
ncbi:hypothetical protein RB195_004795 [Necator americanus]|uniref:Cyclin C-terminal domain-containing protein n=1 Tax=Necator americanus TaxID=51031 RepID=A0ABR1BJR6_NECAM